MTVTRCYHHAQGFSYAHKQRRADSRPHLFDLHHYCNFAGILLRDFFAAMGARPWSLANRHPLCAGHPNPHPGANPFYLYPRAYPAGLNRAAQPDVDAYQDFDGDRYPHFNHNRNDNCNSDLHCNSDGDGDCHAVPDGDPYPDAASVSDTHPNTTPISHGDPPPARYAHLYTAADRHAHYCPDDGCRSLRVFLTCLGFCLYQRTPASKY